MLKLIIVDDQSLLRKSLCQIISTDETLTVVGQAENGNEAIELCEKLNPDIVLMDIEMQYMDGITALTTIKQHQPAIKVIILTTFENQENIVEAFLAQADGYITKDIGPDELITTIKCVGYGLTVICKSVKTMMVYKFKKMVDGKKNYIEILTKEEIDMVRLIADGRSNKEIAKSFNYTEGTIKNKVSKIYEKLSVSDRLQLVVYAMENGIDG